jgi:glyoxylase-like metal-dependent hydrolase (beta-lactamase superfamily II)
MRIHHLNCVSACPLGGLLMDGFSKKLHGRLASHCLLLEASDSLVLIDTGYGLRDVANPRSRLDPVFLSMLQPELREEMTARRQIEALGFRADDVRHIVLSHLDFDHAGGLDDFPAATVHLLDSEVMSATAQASVLDRMRYRPEQWSLRSAWRTYAGPVGETWKGFECVRDLPGLPPEVLMVPLLGHTLGHSGVAIQRDSGWLFYAADAYFYHGEMLQAPVCPPGLRAYQVMMEKDRAARLGNQERLRNLAHADSTVTVFCAHDVRELERLSGRSSKEPAVRQPHADASAPEMTAARAASF